MVPPSVRSFRPLAIARTPPPRCRARVQAKKAAAEHAKRKVEDSNNELFVRLQGTGSCYNFKALEKDFQVPLPPADRAPPPPAPASPRSPALAAVAAATAPPCMPVGVAARARLRLRLRAWCVGRHLPVRLRARWCSTTSRCCG